MQEALLPRVETTHKYRSRKHNVDKPWAFPCGLSFGSQFHEALESHAAFIEYPFMEH